MTPESLVGDQIRKKLCSMRDGGREVHVSQDEQGGEATLFFGTPKSSELDPNLYVTGRDSLS